MYQQLYQCLNNCLKNIVYRFHKAPCVILQGYSTQNALFKLIQLLEKQLKNSVLVPEILMVYLMIWNLKYMVLINIVLFWVMFTWVFGNIGQKVTFHIVTRLILVMLLPIFLSTIFYLLTVSRCSLEEAIS